MDFKHIGEDIVRMLGDLGIESYIWHVASTGSVYIRFGDSRMCSIRIGDHDGREKLKYKYNIRSDVRPGSLWWYKDGGIWRCYISIDRWMDIIDLMVKRRDQVQSWGEGDSKYEYGVPEYKTKTKDIK